MYEPIRGGTRGGAAEFKWTDVSADKDREHYLGHSINAPTGRWQKNKDVHWYSRDEKTSEAERREEIRRVKEAEAEALSVALGFKPTVRADPNAPAELNGEDSENKAAESLQPSEDIQIVLAREHRKREKEERRAEKEKRRAEKEQRRAAREEHRREQKERENAHRHNGHGPRSHYEGRGREYPGRQRERSYSRSMSPPMRSHDDRRGGQLRSPSRSPPYQRDYEPHHATYHKRAISRTSSPSEDGNHRRYTPPSRDLPVRAEEHDYHKRARSYHERERGYDSPLPREEDHYRDKDRRQMYPRDVSRRRRTDYPPPRPRFDSPTRRSRSFSPRR